MQNVNNIKSHQDSANMFYKRLVSTDMGYEVHIEKEGKLFVYTKLNIDEAKEIYEMAG